MERLRSQRVASFRIIAAPELREVFRLARRLRRKADTSKRASERVLVTIHAATTTARLELLLVQLASVHQLSRGVAMYKVMYEAHRDSALYTRDGTPSTSVPTRRENSRATIWTAERFILNDRDEISGSLNFLFNSAYNFSSHSRSRFLKMNLIAGVCIILKSRSIFNAGDVKYLLAGRMMNRRGPRRGKNRL